MVNLLHQKIVVLAVFALFFGLLGSAYAHKSQVVGNYEIEVGWKNEPPIVGKENAITVMITSAATDDIVEHDDMTDDEEMSENTNQTVAESEHGEITDEVMIESEHDEADLDETEHDEAEHEAEHDELNGVSGLDSVLEVSVTLGEEKTDLTLVEDDETPGLYIGAYTPTQAGQPLVHLFGTINEDTIEVTFHPEAVENASMTPIQQQNEGVEPKNVTCPEELVLLGKKSTNTAVCVTQKTADLLIARDWAFHFE